jgi:hypothetical protein
LVCLLSGASYCDIGYRQNSPHPSRERPLGVEFPGDTYAEPGEPNWVGHLVKKYIKNEVLVYDYAQGGSCVDGVRHQIGDIFLNEIGKKQWLAEDTIFMTWVGINDAALGCDHGDNLAAFFAAQELLYEAGGRNFLFIDVPPIHRSPGVRRTCRDMTANYVNWNTELRKCAAKFSVEHSDATIMVFSSWNTFTQVLDNPQAEGFSEDDVGKEGGAIWFDHLHPTSRMHDIIARDISRFLDIQPIQEATNV